MINVGIAGLGFMGKMHIGVYSGNSKAKIVALSDVNAKKLKGDWSGVEGNIGGSGAGKVDLTGVKVYEDTESLIKDENVRLVDITLPTYMHAKYVCMALSEGKDVLCEKPIALTLKDADRILEAAARSKGKLMIAHCIRFWPEYEILKKYIQSNKYGRVYSASFGRFSPTPLWGWKNWQQAGRYSGGAGIDLHIHDADLINWCFGMPRGVCSAGITKTSGAVDHIATIYQYNNKIQVLAEGGWAYHSSFPFEMSYRVIFEKATVEYNCARQPALKVHSRSGRTITPKVPAGDGYGREIDYFLDCLRKGMKPKTVTPKDARNSLKIVLAEVESVRKGKPVRVG